METLSDQVAERLKYAAYLNNTFYPRRIYC